MAVPKAMSLLGSVLSRQLDCRLNIYAVNSVGTPYYSFGTSSAAPLMSQNITSLIISQYPEYSQLVRTYGLIKMQRVEIQFSRTSSLIQNVNVIGNSPSVFLQLSQTSYTAGSVTLQNSLATADNSVEINVQTFDPYSFLVNLPPSIVGRSQAANDIFVYGSQTWIPTVMIGAQVLPDLFVNLGTLEQPSFQVGAANTAYQLATLHVKIHCNFASPQSL